MGQLSTLVGYISVAGAFPNHESLAEELQDRTNSD